MNRIKKTGAVFFLFTALFFPAPTAAQTRAETVSAVNTIDWQNKSVTTEAALDAKAEGIILPEGRETASRIIKDELYALASGALFSVAVDSSTTLGEAVSEGSVTLAQILSLIDSAKQTPVWFSRDLKTCAMTSTIELSSISRIFVRHNSVYKPKKPLEAMPTRPYSGIIIDARGNLPVHGEFTESKLSPAMFPKIWNTEMNLVYERNMVLPQTARQEGIVSYAVTPEDKNCILRAGNDPLYIRAAGVYGIFRTDPVISRRDYLRIFCDEENISLLEQGKVVILCDEDMIRGEITPRARDDGYYFIRREIERTLARTRTDGVGISERGRGITLTIYGIRFVADSPEILPEEEGRIAEIARTLVSADASASFLIEGHTASVGRPAGELQLSRERAQVIAQRLINAGISAERISTEGYGGTRPAADNSTEEGRAQNRRVEITILLPE